MAGHRGTLQSLLLQEGRKAELPMAGMGWHVRAQQGPPGGCRQGREVMPGEGGSWSSLISQPGSGCVCLFALAQINPAALAIHPNPSPRRDVCPSLPYRVHIYLVLNIPRAQNPSKIPRGQLSSLETRRESRNTPALQAGCPTELRGFGHGFLTKKTRADNAEGAAEPAQ